MRSIAIIAIMAVIVFTGCDNGGTNSPEPCDCNGIAGDCDCATCDCASCETSPLPAANAGSDQTQTLSNTLTITLNGTASTNSTAYAWECKSYTANKGTVNSPYTESQVTALIANADKTTATVVVRTAGTYVFKLTVTGDGDLSDTDEVTIVINPMPVSKSVTVSFPAFAAGSQTLNLTPNYNTDWGDLGTTITSVSLHLEKTVTEID